MLTTRLTDKKIPDYDINITEFIRSEAFEGGGNKMIIGIENTDKEIYRVIETTGFGDFMEVVGFLTDFGFIDLLEQQKKMVDGMDARFRLDIENAS